MSWPSAQFVSLEALTRQPSYHAIPLPKLDVVAVNKVALQIRLLRGRHHNQELSIS
jgi:hypothetical protein